MRCEWQEVRLGEVILFNPSERIVKGNKAKKIAMDKLAPFSKFINEYEVAEFNGGAKFRNGDTLLARITPCLENGKTSQVSILDRDEVGFGSTEFIVMRGKEHISDKDFIFYLSISPPFRDIAIKSMVGSSGRQRVQQSVLDNMVMEFPPLPQQKRIAAILSSLDDKIELNNRMNKNLEAQAQAIFKSWFVDFEPFQDGEFVDSELGMIPSGWRVGRLGELIDSIDNRGKTPPFENVPTDYPIIDVKALSSDFRTIDFNNCSKFVSKDTYYNFFRSGHPKKLDILISTVGSLAEMKLFYGIVGCVAQNVVAFRAKNISPYYLYQYLQNIKNNLISYNIGSVQPSIKVTHIVKHLILIPDTKALNLFDGHISNISSMIFSNYNQSQTLAALRDTLLPKLMNGEIDLT